MPPPSASSGSHWRRTQVAGKNTAYSTPSIAADPAGPGIAVQGRNHSLWYLSRTSGHWHGQQPLDSGFVTRLIGVAFRGPSNSVAFFYFSTSSGNFVNDVLRLPANGHGSSAPALFFRTANPASEDDLIFQGTGNTLWYYHALKPGADHLAPQFTGSKIAAAGSTFGG
jgi:hypothetical protein